MPVTRLAARGKNKFAIIWQIILPLVDPDQIISNARVRCGSSRGDAYSDPHPFT
jgi:hypothetical protein